jgi:hypothetical protein
MCLLLGLALFIGFNMGDEKSRLPEWPKMDYCIGTSVKGDAHTMAANRARCASMGCPQCGNRLSVPRRKSLNKVKKEEKMDTEKAENIVGHFVLGEFYQDISQDSKLKGIYMVSEACEVLGLDEKQVRAIRHIVEDTFEEKEKNEKNLHN